MDTEEIEVFLTLAEELHFGRTALRLRLPQPRVSRLVATLERRVGGALFERTSRSVLLTPAGERLRDELLPAYDQVQAALRHASEAARQAAGVLTVGFTVTTNCEAVTRVIEEFEARNPSFRSLVREVDVFDPWTPLRDGQIDVEFNHLTVDEPDLAIGPPVVYGDRVLVVGRGHALAGRESVSVEDIADWEVVMLPAFFPQAMYDAIVPPRTPTGRPIRRRHEVRTVPEFITLIALGRAVHPTGSHISLLRRDDLLQIPIRDMPPLAIGPIWCTAREDPRIRALVRAARTLRATVRV